MEYEMMQCWEGEDRSEDWPVCFERGGLVLVRIVPEGILLEVGNILFYLSGLEK